MINGLKAALAAVLCVLAAIGDTTVLVACCGLAAVLVLNHVDLTVWFRIVVVRRLLRLVPYAAAVISELPTFAVPRWWSWPLCVGPILAWQVIDLGRIRKIVRLTRLGLFPAETVDERSGRLTIALLSAPAQECLHRGLLLTALVPYLGGFAIVVAAATFVLEHVWHANARVRTSARDVTLWVGMSLVFGVAVYLDPAALWPAIIGHGLVNLPNAVRALVVPRRSAWDMA